MKKQANNLQTATRENGYIVSSAISSTSAPEKAHRELISQVSRSFRALFSIGIYAGVYPVGSCFRVSVIVSKECCKGGVSM